MKYIRKQHTKKIQQKTFKDQQKNIEKTYSRKPRKQIFKMFKQKDNGIQENTGSKKKALQKDSTERYRYSGKY
jgi:hypothetical protein